MEARWIQKLYQFEASGQGDPLKGLFPLPKEEALYRGLFADGRRRSLCFSSKESNNTLVAPLEQSGMLCRVRKMKNSSFGPDEVTYEDLNKAD